MNQTIRVDKYNVYKIEKMWKRNREERSIYLLYAILPLFARLEIWNENSVEINKKTKQNKQTHIKNEENYKKNVIYLVATDSH